MSRKRSLTTALVFTAAVAVTVLAVQFAGAAPPSPPAPPAPPVGPVGDGHTKTPIKHVVVIFQENVSFDHYFGTYPNAANTDGQTFTGAPDTPAVDGLMPATDSSLPLSLRHGTDLTVTNPNLFAPLRLDSTPTGASGGPGGQLTCDQDHNYSDEQQAFDNGAMDQFVQSVGTASGTSPGTSTPCAAKTVMDYYDGNAVTGLWNYAEHFAMSDNSFGTTFGPSAPGAVNLASGDTGDVDTTHEANSPTVATATAPDADITPDGKGGYSLTSDAQPYWDDCSTRDAVALKGTNIGDSLNADNISWGWFEGGFRPTTTFAAAAAGTGHTGQSTSTFIPDEFSGSFTGKVVPPHASNQALCDAVSPVGAAFGATTASAPYGYKDDYIPHHEPFQFYASTANPHHLTITANAGGDDLLTGADSLSSVGRDTQSYVAGVPQFNTPNHNYDTSDFDQLVAAINDHKLPPDALPAVTFLKAPGVGDGHAAYSDPADEQAFIVREVNALEQSPDWSSTAVIINYDDSDGWYDHVYSGVTNGSASPADNLTNTVTGHITAGHPTSQQCGTAAQASAALNGEQGRCGLGPRLPMMVISPCAQQNYVDHNLSDQASIINFIEYNWSLPGIPGSYDQALAKTDKAEGVPFDLAGMFDFKCDTPTLPLDPATGQIDLAGANINGPNYAGYDFAEAGLANAKLNGDLEGAFFANANLTGAALHDAMLQGASFEGANLTGADLHNASLQGANLANANLANATLADARLNGATTRGATWSNTTCPDHTNSNDDGGSCVGHLSHP